MKSLLLFVMTSAVCLGANNRHIAFAGAAQNTKASEDVTFRPYLSCRFDDGLKTTDTIRLPKDAGKFREVDTSNGKSKVTRVDGYTVEFAYPNTDVFVNLKVEQSDPRSHARDKEVILENMRRLLVNAKAIDEREPKKVSVNGVDVYGYDRNVIGLGTVIGMHVFLKTAATKS